MSPWLALALRFTVGPFAVTYKIYWLFIRTRGQRYTKRLLNLLYLKTTQTFESAKHMKFSTNCWNLFQ